MGEKVVTYYRKVSVVVAFDDTEKETTELKNKEMIDVE